MRGPFFDDKINIAVITKHHASDFIVTETEKYNVIIIGQQVALTSSGPTAHLKNVIDHRRGVVTRLDGQGPGLKMMQNLSGRQIDIITSKT